MRFFYFFFFECLPCKDVPDIPDRTDKKVDRMFKKRRFFSFKKVPDKLKDPPNDKQGQRKFPSPEKERQRNNNQRYADRMGQFVYGMLMILFILFDERWIGHLLSLLMRTLFVFLGVHSFYLRHENMESIQHGQLYFLNSRNILIIVL